MQPVEPSGPPQRETSLELTFAEDAGQPSASSPSPSSSSPSPSPSDENVPAVAPGPAPIAEPESEPSAPGPLGDLVVAHFQRVEVAMLGRVLITTLAGALPASMVRVQRRRTLAQRLTGRPGEPIGIDITAGERTLSFRAPELGVAEASVGHAVRGVVLSSSPVSVAQWLDELGELLNQMTRNDEATRNALERALLH